MPENKIPEELYYRPGKEGWWCKFHRIRDAYKEILIKAGKGNCVYLTENGSVYYFPEGDSSPFDTIGNKENRYLLKPDYKPEPEVVEYTISPAPGNIWRVDNPELIHLSILVLPGFCDYLGIKWPCGHTSFCIDRPIVEGCKVLWRKD